MRSIVRALTLPAFFFLILTGWHVIRSDAALSTNKWTGGTGSWTNAADWNLGTVPNNTPTNQYAVLIDGGNPVASGVWIDQFLSITINSLVLDGDDTLTISNGATLSTTNGLTCNGTLRLANTLNATYLAFSGTQTLGGTGQVVMSGSDPGGDALYDTGGVLTIGSNITVHCLGGGLSGDPNHLLANQGTINAEGGGQLVTIHNMLNEGTLLVSNSALVQAYSLTNSGTVTIDDLGTLQSFGDYVQTSGVTMLSGVANLAPQSGASVLIKGGSLAGDGYIGGVVTNNALLLPGLLLFPGNLTLAAGSVVVYGLGGYLPVTQYDLISCSNKVTLGGLLSVMFVNNYGFISSVTNGAGFTLLTSGAPLSGAFTNVASGSPLRSSDGFASFVVTYTGDNVVLSGLTILSDENDGIPNWWREEYFGSFSPTNNVSCASCDADGTGQNNLFKYVAGLNPLAPSSVFQLIVHPVAGQPGEKQLSFGPLASNRTYTVQFTTNLVKAAAWSALTTGGAPQTNGSWITVTDLAATQTNKIYRVQITH